MKNCQKWASTDHPLSTRLMAMIPAGILFLFLLPYLLVVQVPRLDPFFHLLHLFYGTVNIPLGLILILAGGFFAIWSILSQFFLAEGTPLPMLPTQKLLVSGPFRLCRNPMTLGTILAYSGVAVLVGSLSPLIVVLLFGGALLCYLKFLEEKELAERFGQEYLEYKAATPFLLPRITANKKPKDS